MIIYELQCGAGHRFEGWFPGMDACETQLSRQMVNCAICGSVDVRRIPAGGHVGHRHSRAADAAPARTTAAAPAHVAGAMPETLSNIDPVILVKALHHFVRTQSRDVGDQFADQVLQMHQGTAPSEPISGTASPEQREQLEDAGVNYASIPALPDELEQ